MTVNLKAFRIALVGLFLCIASAIQAQTTVTGNVKDATGEGVIGATIMEKGTKNGTVTDIDGNFTIKMTTGKTLVFSYVGMKTKEVKVSGNGPINVVLEDDNTTLNDVVVIGYGTVRKKDLTGAVAQVDAKQIENIPVTDVSQALQGKMSGVNITVSDGAPDAETNIRVRGGGSLSQDNSPLYIVDGFEVSSISDIAPSEIKSIDVLKDASSTAIYGAKGANGVIIVTTKSGTDSKIPKINFNASWNWKKATKFQKVLSPYDYAMAKYEMTTGSTNNPTGYGSRNSLGYYNDLDIYKSTEGMDYQNELFGRTGFQQQYNVNIAGGSKKIEYNVTYAHDDQNAIMLGSGSSKNNISGKFKWKMNKYLTFDVNVRLSYQNTEGLGSGADTNESNAATSIVANSVAYSPIAGVSFSDDEDDEMSRTNTYSPLQRLNGTYKNVKNNKQTFNFGVTWKPWKHWSFKTEFSYNHGKKTTDQVWTAEATTNAKTFKGSAQSRLYDDKTHGWTSKNYVTYDNRKLFNGRDAINVVVGFDMQSASEKTNNDFRAGYNYSTTSDILNHRDAASNFLPVIYSELQDENMESFYGRLNYTLKEKYLLTITMREDGSSKFAAGNHWGFFPAGSLAWRVSDEPWMKGAENWLSNLKLRLSFGAAGNNRIKSGLLATTYAVADYTTSAPYFSADTRPTQLVKTKSSLYNNNLKWETTITRNFGIDYGFWKGRINGSVELYWNTTKDLLMAVTIPGNAGSTTQYQNFGKTSNKGVELSMNIAAVETKKVSWNFNLNVAYNKNKIDELSQYAGEWQSSNFAGSKVANYEDFRTKAGCTLGEVWGYQTDGWYTPVVYDADGNYISGDIIYNGSSWELDPAHCTNESYKSLGGVLYPGQLKLKDSDGDGEFDTTNDKVKLGTTIPTVTGGFGTDFTWKNKWGNMDCTIFFNYSLGNQILNGTRLVNSYASSTNMSYNLISDFATGSRYSWIDPETGYNLGRPNTDVINYYGSAQGVQNRLAEINANAVTYNPCATTKMLITDDCVEDASFLRLQNVTIGYSLPKKTVKKLHLSNIRFYFTGYNLLCFTNYSGCDPEVSTNSNPMCPGVDYSAYPKTRSFVGGLNVSF